MHDPWIDMMSSYLDGELAPADAASLERHLEGCDECRTILAELRDVVAAAQALDATEPASDLWPGIAAAIAGTPRRPGEPGLAPSNLDVISLASRRRQPVRFSFSLPQIAAAAAVFVVLGGGAVWMAARGPVGNSTMAQTDVAQGPLMLSSNAAPENVQLVGASPAVQQYESDVAELERALVDARDSLDPATVEVIERSLESIDQAIADARSALDADPANPHLHRKLESTFEKKLALLSRASGVQRGGS